MFFQCIFSVFSMFYLFNPLSGFVFINFSKVAFTETIGPNIIDQYNMEGTLIAIKSPNLQEIPKESIVEIVSPDLMLPKPDREYIKLYTNDLESIGEFLPKTPDNKYYQGGYTPTLENALNNQYWNYSASYGHLKNMYCTYTGSFITSDYQFIDIEPISAIKWIRAVANGRVIASFENIVTVGHTQVFQFGHFVADVLAPIVIFPEEIIQKSFVVINKASKRFQELLEACDINLQQVIFVDKGEWVFAKNLYAPISPLPHLSHYGKLITRLSSKLKRYYNTSELLPTRFLFINRPRGLSRRMQNMEELSRMAQTQFPKYNFEYIEDTNSFKESALQWGTAKFMFVIVGSNNAKNVFMQENTVLIVGLANVMESCAPLRSGPLKIFTLEYRNKEMNHWITKPTYCDPKRSMRAISIGMYVVEHGRFNPDESFHDS